METGLRDPAGVGGSRGKEVAEAPTCFQCSRTKALSEPGCSQCEVVQDNAATKRHSQPLPSCFCGLVAEHEVFLAVVLW